MMGETRKSPLALHRAARVKAASVRTRLTTSGIPAVTLALLLTCLGARADNNPGEVSDPMTALSRDKAEYLYQFAFHCIDQEYPNKTGHTMADADDLATPSTLHPAFYGCLDWHSAVHGHWTLVKILTLYPQLEAGDAVRQKLARSLTRENILQEAAYFEREHNETFERTYGWVWLLKLAEALDSWDDPLADRLQRHLQPLTDLLEARLIEFLPKLTYPVRVGEHPNTAFALSFALDYARSFQRDTLEALIVSRARDYYLSDRQCPLAWEPGGFDFLSPCLQEAALMAKVLPPAEYLVWAEDFLPELFTGNLGGFQPAVVSDRSDGKLAHLDGLNFSRAWCLYEISRALDRPALISLAEEHLAFSYDKISADEYAGAHWLASFALYALQTEMQWP